MHVENMKHMLVIKHMESCTDVADVKKINIRL